jgi:hypothetical protein
MLNIAWPGSAHRSGGRSRPVTASARRVERPGALGPSVKKRSNSARPSPQGVGCHCSTLSTTCLAHAYGAKRDPSRPRRVLRVAPASSRALLWHRHRSPQSVRPLEVRKSRGLIVDWLRASLTRPRLSSRPSRRWRRLRALCRLSSRRLHQCTAARPSSPSRSDPRVAARQRHDLDLPGTIDWVLLASRSHRKASRGVQLRSVLAARRVPSSWVLERTPRPRRGHGLHHCTVNPSDRAAPRSWAPGPSQGLSTSPFRCWPLLSGGRASARATSPRRTPSAAPPRSDSESTPSWLRFHGGSSTGRSADRQRGFRSLTQPSGRPSSASSSPPGEGPMETSSTRPSGRGASLRRLPASRASPTMATPLPEPWWPRWSRRTSLEQ